MYKLIILLPLINNLFSCSQKDPAGENNQKAITETSSSVNSNQAEVVSDNKAIISPDSKAYEFMVALADLKKSGETQKIYDKYFK